MSERKSDASFFKKTVFTFFKWFFCTLGVCTFVLFILSFTSVPYYAYHDLSLPAETLKKKPDVIVVLGGSGMPSPDGLIRMYYTATAAHQYKQAAVITAY